MSGGSALPQPLTSKPWVLKQPLAGGVRRGVETLLASCLLSVWAGAAQTTTLIAGQIPQSLSPLSAPRPGAQPLLSGGARATLWDTGASITRRRPREF